MVTSHHAPDTNHTQAADIVPIVDATKWEVAGMRSRGKPKSAEDPCRMNYYAVTCGQMNYCAVNCDRMNYRAVNSCRMNYRAVNSCRMNYGAVNIYSVDSSVFTFSLSFNSLNVYNFYEKEK